MTPTTEYEDLYAKLVRSLIIHILPDYFKLTDIVDHNEIQMDIPFTALAPSEQLSEDQKNLYLRIQFLPLDKEEHDSSPGLNINLRETH